MREVIPKVTGIPGARLSDGPGRAGAARRADTAQRGDQRPDFDSVKKWARQMLEVAEKDRG